MRPIIRFYLLERSARGPTMRGAHVRVRAVSSGGRGEEQARVPSLSARPSGFACLAGCDSEQEAPPFDFD